MANKRIAQYRKKSTAAASRAWIFAENGKCDILFAVILLEEKMKILVTGAKGQLGYDTVKELAARKIEAVCADIGDFDITDKAGTLRYINQLCPDAVIHCAAYTAVDKAEDEPALCTAVNVQGSENIALACENSGAKLIYVSTDYVFGGEGSKPLEVDSPKKPLNVYGSSKLAGEQAVQNFCTRNFIVRTSWVFGKNGNNFVKTMLRLGSQTEKITVVDDQTGSPTYTSDLAGLLCDMVRTDKYGVYHATNEGFCSWAEFAEEIMRQANLPAKIIRIKTSEYGSKATRPLNSRLSKSSLDSAGFHRLPAWQDALRRYLTEI